MRRMLVVAPAFAVALALPAAAQKPGWYEKAVKKVEARFDPPEAKPGQTVTLKLTVELNEGYHTYPTKQPDKEAASMVNQLKFPDPGAVVFVGGVTDPDKYVTKAEPALGIKELREYEGKVTFTRKAVVSPKAAAGPAAVKLTEFKLMVCDQTNCFPPKKVPVEAALKVLPGPAVEVEKAYADEVAKALAGK
ncbi:MAG: protein-disulfide reductase DsbD N-terminal domain-containing protein [Gemmataceae bacterium]|nr:protein-disulfide reductase DsbD N-terminal domain-containing protein [Gemmataceae bacterium]